MVYASIHVYKKKCMDMVDRYIQRNPQITTRTVIGSRHDLLTITAGTVIRFATVTLSDPAYCRAITLIDLIGFDALFFLSSADALLLSIY